MNKYLIAEQIFKKYFTSSRAKFYEKDKVCSRVQALLFLTISKLAFVKYNVQNLNFAATSNGPMVLEIYNLHSNYSFGYVFPFFSKTLGEKDDKELKVLNEIIKETINKTNNISTNQLIEHIKQNTPWSYPSENSSTTLISDKLIKRFSKNEKNINKLFSFEKENLIEN